MLSCNKPNIESKLIKHIVDNKLINPFRLVDIGARGGISEVWKVFNPLLQFVGFDSDTDKSFIIPKLLSNEKSKRRFYLLDYPQSSSFYLPDYNFTNRLRDSQMLQLKSEIELETSTLDEYDLKPDFLKIDAEGAELDILLGSHETLKYLIGLEVEVCFFQQRIKQPVFSDIDTFLRSQGFNLYNMRLLRYPRKPVVKGNYHLGNISKGQIISAHCVYFRDLIPILNQCSKDKILKQACLLDLFECPDCAVELLMYSDNKDLAGLVDVSECYA